jgi:transposase
MPASEEFAHLRLRFIDPIQHDYEVIRPVVLFAQPVAERSRETDLERTTVGEKARRFVTNGMLGLADQRPHRAGRKGHEYPDPIANYILYLKQLYPPIHYREIVRIVARKFGYKTNHHTVKAFLARHPVPLQLEFDLETFHEFGDAYQARWTVVRLFYEGWEKQSIAGLLQLSRQHVVRLIDAFEQDGFAGLEDKRTRRESMQYSPLRRLLGMAFTPHTQPEQKCGNGY